MNSIHKNLLKGVLLLVSIIALMGCTSTMLCGGVLVSPPSNITDKSPAVCVINMPYDSTFDHIKLILAKCQFLIAVDDYKIGLIQTSERTLLKDETYTFTAGQRIGLAMFGAHQDAGPKGRIQIIIEKIDSTTTKCSITAFISVTMTVNLSVGDTRNLSQEEQAFVGHPIVQKYLCMLQNKDCGPAPGQTIYVKPTRANERNW